MTDQNGVEIQTGEIRLSQPILSFGDGIEPRIDFEASFPFSNSNSVGDVRTLISSATNPITRNFVGNCCGNEIESAMTPSGMAIWYNYTLDEIATGNGQYFKKPAGGVFNVPYYNGVYTNTTRKRLGMVNARGDVFSSNSTGSFFTKANGEVWKILYQSSNWGTRIRNISTNRGYFVQYQYEREATPTAQSQMASWRTVTKISGASLAYVYCDTTSTSLCANAASEGNYVTFDYTDGATITHASGAQRKYKLTAASALEISTPGTNSLTTITKAVPEGTCDDENVSQITYSGSTWTYEYVCIPAERGNDWSLIRTSPTGGKFRSFGVSWDAAPEMYQDEMLGVHYIGSSLAQGYQSYYPPEGGRIYRTRDSRNNTIEIGRMSKDNSSTLIAYKASFPATCSNFVTCNQPTWTRDGNGNQTDYAYDPTHGGLLTETGPADANGVRPQKRYEYVQRYAWLKNSSGTYSQAASPIWVKIREKYCISSAASAGGCAAGTLDEVITEYEYGPDSGPNNLLVRGIAVTADGQTLRTCYGYDRMGRKISETKPAANLTSCP
ncbi:MAG: hypothetical protein ACTHKO_02050 [Sphingopyxis terrae]